MSKIKGAVSHHEAELAELRADRELAVAYLKAAMESLDDPDDRAAGLLALRPELPAVTASDYFDPARESRQLSRDSPTASRIPIPRYANRAICTPHPPGVAPMPACTGRSAR